MDDATQMAVGMAITKQAMDFNAMMTASLINGSIEKGAEMREALARNAGLAAEGIGANLDIAI